jgi:hypothetical protein
MRKRTVVWLCHPEGIYGTKISSKKRGKKRDKTTVMCFLPTLFPAAFYTKSNAHRSLLDDKASERFLRHTSGPGYFLMSAFYQPSKPL